jgi:hypothetical protein
MSLPAWCADFTLDQCLIDEVIDRIPPSHRGKAQSRKVFRVEIDRVPHYVIAGGVFGSSDDGSYFDPSPLLPELEVNFKFDGS